MLGAPAALITCRWLSDEERKLIQERETRHRQQIEEARRRRTFTLDFVNRQGVWWLHLSFPYAWFFNLSVCRRVSAYQYVNVFSLMRTWCIAWKRRWPLTA
jgi:hypothetical protein